MTYRYFEVEDRHYRAPAQDLSRMEIWDDVDQHWIPYIGEVARVIAYGSEVSAANAAHA